MLARRKALVTAEASAPGGAAPFAATRVKVNFACALKFLLCGIEK